MFTYVSSGALWELLARNEKRFFNVIVTSAFISYAVLDSGLGRICLWSYILCVAAAFPITRFLRREIKPKRRVDPWVRNPPTNSRTADFLWAATLINFGIGRSLWYLISGVAITLVVVVLLAAAYAILTAVVGLGVMSFDFLWDFRVDTQSYLDRVWQAFVFFPDKVKELWDLVL